MFRLMRNKRHHWMTGIIALLAAWSSGSMAMKPPELAPPGSDPRYSGVQMQQGAVATDNDLNKDPSRATVPAGTSQPARQLPMRQIAPRLAPTATPLLKKLPGSLMTPPLMVTGDAASAPRLPMAVTTSALMVTGAAETPPTLAAVVNTAALVVTGVADTPPTLPASIATPGLAVTGEAP